MQLSHLQPWLISFWYLVSDFCYLSEDSFQALVNFKSWLMKYRQKKSKTFKNTMCIWCVFWFFCVGFLSFCFLARKTVLHSCTKRKVIKLTHKKEIHYQMQFFILSVGNFFKTLAIPRLLASFIPSLYQVWMLSLLDYGSWGFSVAEVSSGGGNEGIIKRIQGPDTMILYNWNK